MRRALIIREALDWLGTPYQHQASLKGVGCDCLGLVRGVWRAVYGGEPEDAPPYTPDWAEATGRETLAMAARRHMAAVPVEEARGGDAILFRWRANLPAKHIGILIDERSFVHAQQGAAVSHVALSPWWRRRIACAFQFPGVDD